MADLVPVDAFSNVYQIETTDDVLGGPGALSNEQAQALANRTKWIRDRMSVGWGSPGAGFAFYNDASSNIWGDKNSVVAKLHFKFDPLVPTVTLAGVIKNYALSSPTASPLFTLPTVYRPDFNTYVWVGAVDNTLAEVWVKLTIAPSGLVSCAQGLFEVTLDNVSFKIGADSY